MGQAESILMSDNIIQPRDRPAGQAEIEITPEMVESGVLACDEFFETYSTEMLVKEIYKAMIECQLQFGKDFRSLSLLNSTKLVDNSSQTHV